MQELQSLKNKILMLAIQGKLVPQNENDEPASILLQKIQQEKEQLIQEKKLKKEKSGSIIYKKDNQYFEKIGDVEKNITENIPFEIPESWQWVRLTSISKKIFAGGDKPKLFSKNMTNECQIPIYANGITNNGLYGYTNVATVSEKSITISARGTIGFSIIREKPFVPIVRLLVIQPSYYINFEYLNLVFTALFEQGLGSSINQLTVPMITTKFIPLPPLAEQKRIVKKIQELFALIDVIEKNKQELEELKVAFKNKILSLAIQGKLVPQTKTDEPASVLLQKIREEKAKRIKEKKIKNNKQESIIYKKDNQYYEKIGDSEKNITKEIPFKIPNTWQWVRLGDIVNFKLGKTPERAIKEFWNSNDIPWVSISDMTEQNFIRTTKEKISNIAFINKFNKILSPKGTLLMSFKLTVGKTSILSIDAVHNEAIISIFPYFDKDNYFRNYLYIFLPNFSRFGDKKEAIKGVTLNSKSLTNILIPLPPLEEQKRITKKIKKVLMLCDKL